ncbi:MAG TPA: PKD domain-containing protein [Chitinophagales bacterium]|nr:PKD domain-containing protein [Chitinophagales bacterium]
MSQSVSAQYPGIVRDTSWGTGFVEFPWDVAHLSDGSYVVVGETASPCGWPNVNKSFLVHFDSSGSVLDTITSLNGTWSLNSVEHDGNNFLVSGVINVGYVFKTWVAVLDENFTIMWNDTLDEFAGYLGISNMRFTSATDGNYYFATSIYNGAYHDLHLVKLNSLGTVVWNDTLGGSLDDAFIDMLVLNDGSILLSGSVLSNDGDISGNHGSDDIWIVKLRETGDVVWQHCYGGSDGDIDGLLKMVNDSVVLVGASSWSTDGDVNAIGNGGNADAWLFKIDTSGQLLWQKTLGGSWNDPLKDVAILSDGSMLVVIDGSFSFGIGSDNHGAEDAWLFLIDSAGNILWHRMYGGNGSEISSKIIALSDSSFVLLSASNSILNGDVMENCGDLYDQYYCYGYASDVWLTFLNYVAQPCHAVAGFGWGRLCNTFTFYSTSYFADSLQWDFGDGTTDTGEMVIHTYSSNAIDTVCLIAFDGCSSNMYCHIIMPLPPPVSFWWGFSIDSVYLNSQIGGSVLNWYWDFGDGTTDTLSNVGHHYANSGTYNVCIIYSDTCGFTDSVCHEISFYYVSSIDFNSFGQMSVSPNPFDETLIIDFDNLQSTNVNIELSDMSGHILFKSSYSGSERIALNLPDFPVGIFFLRVQSNKFTKMFKVIKD